MIIANLEKESVSLLGTYSLLTIRTLILLLASEFAVETSHDAPLAIAATTLGVVVTISKLIVVFTRHYAFKNVKSPSISFIFNDRRCFIWLTPFHIINFLSIEV